VTAKEDPAAISRRQYLNFASAKELCAAMKQEREAYLCRNKRRKNETFVPLVLKCSYQCERCASPVIYCAWYCHGRWAFEIEHSE